MHNVTRRASKLFTPLRLGDLSLAHRVVLAPLTRNRGTRSAKHPLTWYPTELNVEYYCQRTTPGGLLITEAVPMSLRASGFPGVPGIWTDEQQEGWGTVVDAVHRRGGLIAMQLWHQGRDTHSRLIGGALPLCPSAVPITDSPHRAVGYIPAPRETPQAMTQGDIKTVIREYVSAAKVARGLTFDAVEIHAANGYLPDQFLHSNINQRKDEYGGSPEKRCQFLLELTDAIGREIGFGRLGVRLSPFGYFTQTRGEDRIYQWTYLCQELSKLGLAYVHLIEPRFDEVMSEPEKLADLRSTVTTDDPKEARIEDILSLSPFRKALKDTPCIVAGGYNATNCWEGIETGKHDAIAFGRYFVSTADLFERLRDGKPLARYDRSRFYGPFPDNEVGYTIHPNQVWETVEGMKARAFKPGYAAPITED